MEEETKRCTKCKEVKPITEFYIRNKKDPTRFKSHCKKCLSTFAKTPECKAKQRATKSGQKQWADWVMRGISGDDC